MEHTGIPHGGRPDTPTPDPVVIGCRGCSISGPGCPHCPVAVLAGMTAAEDPDPEHPVPQARMVPIYRPGDPGLAV